MSGMAPEVLRSRLQSPRAADRLAAVERVAEDCLLELEGELRSLLSDDSPYLFLRGDEELVAELRYAALTALQRLCRLADRPLAVGTLRVRAATPAALLEPMADLALRGLNSPQRRAVLGQVDALLDARVRPDPDHHTLLRSYLILRELGQISYRLERPDPLTGLLPLQREVEASQVEGDRPRPHLRVHGAQGHLLGHVYRSRVGWVLDFAESEEAARAERFAATVMALREGGIPQLLFEGEGPSGPGAGLDDPTVPADSEEPALYLQNLGAFLGARFRVELVLDSGE
jgi:hypothetical protein